MKKTFLSALLLIVTSSCFSQETTFSKDAMTKILVKPDQSKINFLEILQKHKGKTTVIEVWASWCSDCVKAMPKLKALQAKHPEVDYVFISMDKDFEKWQEGIKKHELLGDHYWATDGMKGEFGKAINLDWIPRYIVLDKNKNVVLYKAIETDFEKIDTTLTRLKNEN